MLWIIAIFVALSIITVLIFCNGLNEYLADERDHDYEGAV